jgi:hypothetical protein
MIARIIADAPIEDEELTSETIAAIQHANDSLDLGEGISHEEILPEFSDGALLASNQRHDR